MKLKLEEWLSLKEKFNFNTREWWGIMVKPGIREIVILKTKEWNTSRLGTLNMLFMKQLYFNKKAIMGDASAKINVSLINFGLPRKQNRQCYLSTPKK